LKRLEKENTRIKQVKNLSINIIPQEINQEKKEILVKKKDASYSSQPCINSMEMDDHQISSFPTQFLGGIDFYLLKIKDRTVNAENYPEELDY
jgi:hypothetical protein